MLCYVIRILTLEGFVTIVSGKDSKYGLSTLESVSYILD